ncbi:VIT domain-containing protein [Undibacterium cyanobacteriorum]|uniref:VIT domain-containing protein n=1 Tax=Undibacterium cyanobacteriorum TaxID=3073561 RepID=A0ABY9RNK7_9BURK|nr:VIT domain-containing protein [Undibacterium sp. 20NA77.5]WMW81581.1 VIT domain-containing protein [Undibacterium sp. 20NA77.5]
MKSPIYKRLFASLLLITASFQTATAYSQTTPSGALLETSIDNLRGERAIQLKQTTIKSAVAGSIAETTIDLVFYNPNNRVLEGNLQFPLADNQKIIGFALDIGGKMRDAVPVEKAKGRQVFEEIVRRGVDPALLEMTQGNNFKLRVYPIPARGTRTVQLRIMQNLDRVRHQWEFPLALGFADASEKTQVSIHLRGINDQPEVKFGARQINYEKALDGYKLEFSTQSLGKNSRIITSFPQPLKAQTYLQEFQGESYFLAEVPLKSERKSRSLPSKIGLLWDSSNSATQRHIEAELDLLHHYFKAVGNAEVHLQRLRDRPEAIEIFTITNGNWSKLRKALETTVYDGASAIADWKVEADIGEYLLVSDGLMNYGPKQFPQLSKQQKLFAINSAQSADTNRLSALAERQHGRLIQVDINNVSNASKLLLTDANSVVEALGTHLSDIELESMVPDGDVLRVAGKLKAKQAELSLDLKLNGKPQKINLAINNNAPQHPLAAFLWANYRLRKLEGDREMQKAEIRRLGKKFAIPNSETSLIVLENLSDYLQYDIAPPVELLDEFNRLKSDAYRQRQDSQRHQTEALVTQFQEKIKWWETDFQKLLAKKKEEELRRKEEALKAEALRREEDRKAAIQLSKVSAKPDSSGTKQVALEMRAAPPRPVAPEMPKSVTITGARVRYAEVMNSNSYQTVSTLNRESATMDAVASNENNSASISLKKWVPDARYIKRLTAAEKDKIYTIYLDEKPSYQNSSAFFLDAADILKEKGQSELAMRVLSNLLEMDLENRHILRLLGYRLMELGAYHQAVQVFEKVVPLAEEEPQSYRDLGLALAADKQYQAAINQLQQVIHGNWNGRFQEIKLITLAEINALIVEAKNSGVQVDTSSIDPRLIRNLPLDIRVVMSWDADASDMDLWVKDPSGEECSFNHTRTSLGGRISYDVTQGYGPEEFSLRKAMPGKYQIYANFYGNRQQIVAGATTVQLKLISHFGSEKAKEKLITVRLKDQGGRVFIGEFEFMPEEPVKK